ncbi:MAG: phosphoribosylformylglycinamidine cyclo-ligase [Planctomycetaceae bacterium]|nr:phosphoribosylformylglycinamidine cyclo-ligase [Planctomycetaceae bacterium]
MAISYKEAGVDLDVYEDSMSRLPALIQRTQTSRVMPLMGGFAGLFRLNEEGKTYRDPVLVSGTDGVGTKLKVAMLVGRYDTVGRDLVAMCVNDCICLGAEPLFFLDYLAMAKDDPELTEALVKGVSDGCVDAEASLIGGETAIMPDLYAPGDFDMAGFCVGVVERDQLIDGSGIHEGDLLIGVESSGFHSNGFSLIRKAVFEVGGLNVDDSVPEFGRTVGEELLTPTRIYARLVNSLMKDDSLRPQISGIAHITGGGLADNTGRIVPNGMQAQIQRESWKPLPVFGWLQRLAEIDREEMFRVFNMGIGLVLVVRPQVFDTVLAAVQDNGFKGHRIGQIAPGKDAAVYLD